MHTISEVLELAAAASASDTTKTRLLQATGERILVSPATLEEFARERARGVAFVRLCAMARTGEIHPLNHGLYPLQWFDEWAPKDVGHFELTQADFDKVAAALPLPGARGQPPSTSPMPLTRAALVAKYQGRWPTIERDLKDARRNGLSIAKAGERRWHEAVAAAWARSRGKLLATGEQHAADALTQAMSSLPSRKHMLGD